MVVLHFIQTAAGACGLRGGAVLQYRQPGTSRVNCENVREILVDSGRAKIRIQDSKIPAPCYFPHVLLSSSYR